MEIRNLRKEDVNELMNKVQELSTDNPGIITKVFSHLESEAESNKNIEQEEKVLLRLDKLEKKVNRLLIHFGLAKDEVLIV